MAKSLKGSISNLFNARIQKSQSSSQVEEASGEDMNEVHVEPNESVVANEEFSEEEASGEDMDEAHESEGVDVANDEFREEHNEDNLGDGGVNEEASVSMLDLEKDVDVNYDPGLWGIINDTKRLFKHKPMTTSLAKDGTSDWHNLPTKLREHEKNPEHNHNVVKWVDLQMRLKQEVTIDKQMEALINKERVRWNVDTSSNNWGCEDSFSK
uniref:Uncharacterized protein n=2 Tax=Fagus sylvatica TaxID=28930 RepID=A0A2N9FX75_FAGSY